MAVGERIKRARKFRKITQKELGLAVGFDDNTADVRIAQYESGIRNPKEALLRKIAQDLDVSYASLYEPTLYSAEDVMHTLFEMDENYGIRIFDVVEEHGYSKTVKAINFNSNLMEDFMAEWQQRKRELASGVISIEEYTEWKLNWPQTCEGVDGKFEAKKQWRKPPEEETKKKTKAQRKAK